MLRIADPQIRFGRFDGAGRILFPVWMAWTLSMSKIPILWMSIVPETLWAIAQWLPLRRG
ncbi:hypothetical protein ACFFTM_11385 [Pseudoduganella plicata]|uniref:Uncharacterized protein n=1 Tax=Pseudoduganella plicata TaxID=321984 RepID=A0A4V1ATK2_9BURK|nr:hypothetical protein [Pseudoduganella plicata]QBQ35958.1 hypothetical protein E1742_07195 [Pseudoduganella plicata]GGY79177.1 hypothetical protein GCM10007388_10230 [Pseudoduganella plicata]